MTLRELFEVMWAITELHITARDPGSKYLHRWIYGPDAQQKETIHQYHERMEGKLTIVDGRINAHGESTRGGSEIGWGVKEKLFPAETSPLSRPSSGHSRYFPRYYSLIFCIFSCIIVLF